MKTVTFTPAANPLYRGVLPELVEAQRTAYGLVIHPTLDDGPRRKFSHWDVSDPETGGLVAKGDFPGREGAIAEIVRLAQFHFLTGGLRTALELARERHQKLQENSNG